MRTLRSKSQRNALWIAAGGRCQMCGRELPEGWHADHIVPWVQSQRTNVHEMQALCPACNLKKGAKFMNDWRDYLDPSPAWEARDGHVVMYDWAANIVAPSPRAAAQMATGYGKTLVAYGVFMILKARGICNRMLVFTPGDEQRAQFVEDLDKDARPLLGCSSRAWVSEKVSREYRLAESGEADVFVACYQQLNDRHYDDLLQRPGTTWLIVLDEYHHLHENGIWARRQDSLPGVARLYLSAEPNRSDGRKLLNAPPVPIVAINYQRAYREKAVRLITCHNEHFAVHCEDPDGEPHKLTTQMLQAEKVEDFQTYEVRRQLRYRRDYLDWMLLDPLLKLQEKQLRHHAILNTETNVPAKQHQGIAFAMSCKHAHHVCGMLRELARQIGWADFSCDWVGVGDGLPDSSGAPIRKSDAENRETIRLLRSGQLDFIVQVNKIGEGFSQKTASVLVFLNLIRAEPYLIQQIGRGLRRNPNIIPFEDDVCDIYVSADSPVAKVVLSMEAEVRPPHVPEDADKGGSETETPNGLFNIPDLVLVRASYSHREVLTPVGINIMLAGQDLAFAERFGIPPADLVAYKANLGRSGPLPGATPRHIQDQLHLVAEQVDKATGLYVGNLIKLLRDSRRPVDGSTAGKLKKAVNGRWIEVFGHGHDDMVLDDFQRKHSWLQELNRELKQARRLPEWLRL